MRCTAFADDSKEEKMNKSRRSSTERLTVTALLTALVAVLAYFGGFIKFGVASVNLTLVPVIIGAALLGPAVGAWLGAVSGVVFFMTADAAFWLGLNIPGTLITVMAKGILAGLCAGLIYRGVSKALSKFGVGDIVATFAAAVVCPVINTGLFLVGCLVFFRETVLLAGASAAGLSLGSYMLFGMVGVNFLLELAANVLLAPAICSLIKLARKK